MTGLLLIANLALYFLLTVSIAWLLHKYVSSKPWHRWIRYGVWLGFVGLLTFDSIYYQIAVVHGMCKADQERVYPTPPASLVVGGPYTDEQIKKIEIPFGHFIWPCQKTTDNMVSRCIINGITYEQKNYPLAFGGNRKEFVLKNILDNKVYYKNIYYEQGAQWFSKQIFGYGFVWLPQPESCESIRGLKQTIILD